MVLVVKSKVPARRWQLFSKSQKRCASIYITSSPFILYLHLRPNPVILTSRLHRETVSQAVDGNISLIHPHAIGVYHIQIESGLKWFR